MSPWCFSSLWFLWFLHCRLAASSGSPISEAGHGSGRADLYFSMQERLVLETVLGFAHSFCSWYHWLVLKRSRLFFFPGNWDWFLPSVWIELFFFFFLFLIGFTCKNLLLTILNIQFLKTGSIVYLHGVICGISPFRVLLTGVTSLCLLAGYGRESLKLVWSRSETVIIREITARPIVFGCYVGQFIFRILLSSPINFIC